MNKRKAKGPANGNSQRINSTPKFTTPWKTLAGAAAYVECSEHWIQQMVKKGLLRQRFLGESPRFHQRDLDDLVNKLLGDDPPINTTPRLAKPQGGSSAQ